MNSLGNSENFWGNSKISSEIKHARIPGGVREEIPVRLTEGIPAVFSGGIHVDISIGIHERPTLD